MVRRLFELAIVIVLSLLLLTFIMSLWTAEWRIPFYYSSGDAFASQAVFKSIIDNGTYLQNPMLGAPGQLEYYDFPRTDHVQVLIGRILSWFSRDYALLINVFFVLTFPLTAAIAFLVLRSFGISFRAALVCSLLYSFIPYHFVRGQAHFFLNCYFFIPLSIAICLWICRNEPLITRNAKGRLRPTGRSIAATLFCVLIASSGTYYTFFTCFLILISGLYACAQTRRWTSFASASFFLVVLFCVALVNLLPAIRYVQREGKNPVVARRSFAEAEFYALKITGLLLPGNGHRFLPLNRMMRKYPPIMMKENYAAYLGVVGVAGFLILTAWLFFPTTRLNGQELCGSLPVLNGSLLLLGLTGGLGPLFAFVLFNQFRGYNRVSIFLAFFALFAVALVVDRIRQQISGSSFKGAVAVILPFTILAIGLWDQTIPAYVARKPKQLSSFRADAAFIAQIETKLSPGSMIFQLPYHPFPEVEPEHRMKDYDHLRGYLHSTKLRWSYGAMKGRKWDSWQRETAALPLPQLIQTLRSAGFRGLYFDRYGYSGRDQTENELQERLGQPAAVSEDGRLLFFLL